MSETAGDITERLLVDAGICPGMRVLDIGCGHGDVSILARRIVGSDGQVVGVDRDAGSLTAAQERLRALGCSNITFALADLGDVRLEQGQFDAVVGRRVLMYLPDPVQTLTQVSRYLKPRGLAVFQEHDSTMVPARITPFPLHERVSRWIWRTVESEGANLHMGFDLPSVFSRSGFAMEQLRAEAIVITPTTRHPLGAIIRAMLPRITQHGIATEAEIDIDTLEQRLDQERLTTHSPYISDMVFCGWARKRA